MRVSGVVAASCMSFAMGPAMAADLWSEPVVAASIAIPLGTSPGSRHAPRYALSVTDRGTGADAEEITLLNLSAPINEPARLSLNGIPVFASADRNAAGPTDTELTTDETFASIAIVGAVIAGAAGAVIIFNGND